MPAVSGAEGLRLQGETGNAQGSEGLCNQPESRQEGLRVSRIRVLGTAGRDPGVLQRVASRLVGLRIDESCKV